MRSFSYLKDYGVISTSVVGYIKQLSSEVLWLMEHDDNPIYKLAFKKLNEFQECYPKLGEVSSHILGDLLNENNVEYCFKHGKYPEDASKLGMKFERDLKSIFELEERLRKVSLEKWKTSLTSFNDIENGESFMVVGHSTSFLPGTPEFSNYRENNYSKLYLSCSLFSDKEFNTFNGNKTVYMVDVGEDNYISSSSFDTVTEDTDFSSIDTLKEIQVNGNSHFIKVGYTYDMNKSVTAISTPELILEWSLNRELKENGELFKYEKGLTNEIVLDRTKSRVVGGLLFSDGCDLLLDEYLHFKEYNIRFKCLNKGIYREKCGLSAYTEEEFVNFLEALQKLDVYMSYGRISPNSLLGYYNEVVKPMKYSEEIESMIREVFSKYVLIPDEVIDKVGSKLK